MNSRRRSDLELSEQEFERLLSLCDVLDEVQLLRLQCKVGSLIGDPPVGEGRPDRDTVPPPAGLGGPYTQSSVSGVRPAVVPDGEYEDLTDLADALEPLDTGE